MLELHMKLELMEPIGFQGARPNTREKHGWYWVHNNHCHTFVALAILKDSVQCTSICWIPLHVCTTLCSSSEVGWFGSKLSLWYNSPKAEV